MLLLVDVLGGNAATDPVVPVEFTRSRTQVTGGCLYRDDLAPYNGPFAMSSGRGENLRDTSHGNTTIEFRQA